MKSSIQPSIIVQHTKLLIKGDVFNENNGEKCGSTFNTDVLAYKILGASLHLNKCSNLTLSLLFLPSANST